MSSLTRDTRTPGHPGELGRTRRRRDEGPHEPDLCQPGHELAGGVEAVIDTAAARRVEAGRLTQAVGLGVG